MSGTARVNTGEMIMCVTLLCLLPVLHQMEAQSKLFKKVHLLVIKYVMGVNVARIRCMWSGVLKKMKVKKDQVLHAHAHTHIHTYI